MKQIQLLIADDSAFFRDILREIVTADGDIHVSGEANTGTKAVELARVLRPDVVTLDVGMPGLDGLAAIEHIMSSCPVPVVIVTGQPAAAGTTLAFEALRRGALEVVEKGAISKGGGAEFRNLLRHLTTVPVVRHVSSVSRPLLRPVARPVRLPAKPPLAAPVEPIQPVSRAVIVGIAASAGGPPTLVTLLSALPPDFPASIAVVQHLPIGFADSFATFLENNCRLKAKVVFDRAALAPGTIFVAPDDRHLIAEGQGLLSIDGPPLSGHRPSGTLLLRSLGQAFGERAVGVVLTGMGDDGAAGLADMRLSGALTIAQDEASSMIFGMPAAAIEAGGAVEVLSLNDIPAALIRATGKPGSRG